MELIQAIIIESTLILKVVVRLGYWMERIYAKKSDFATTGSPNWNNVAWVQLGWDNLQTQVGKPLNFIQFD